MEAVGTHAEASSPPWSLLGIEPLRAALEYAGMQVMYKADLPAGDGHPIVIFPGLATSERAVAPLRKFCTRLGYAAYDWARGFNVGPRGDVEEWMEDLSLHVRSLVASHHQRVSLIGWSLGGIYAREVAKRMPGAVRHVITIGSPFAGTAKQNNVGLVYRMVNGAPPELDEVLLRRLATPPAVPTTSIYSRSDGIVAWQACVQSGGYPNTENIEVEGSHCGLGWNPAVLRIVADRLAQPEGEWRSHASTHPPVQRATRGALRPVL